MQEEDDDEEEELQALNDRVESDLEQVLVISLFYFNSWKYFPFLLTDWGCNHLSSNRRVGKSWNSFSRYKKAKIGRLSHC